MGRLNGGHRLSAAEIQEILGTSDLAVRNLRITEAYHRLAGELTGLLGERDANWCAFGKWASRTAGQFIRGELAVSPARLLPGSLPRKVERFLLGWAAPHVGANVAEGNRLVFAELAPLFLETVLAYTQEDDPERALERVVATLTPGPLAEGGQDLLISAVRSHHRAMSLPPSPERAQAVLLGSLQIGLHEQSRLQDALAASLAPPLSNPFIPPPVKALAGRVWSRLATSVLMDLQMPAADFTAGRELIPLRLGRDVSGNNGSTAFPSDLAPLTDPELKALLYDLDRTPNSLRGSAAADWSLLAERMNYLVDLFRIWQQEECLHQAPFTSRQAEAIRAGRLPADGPPL